MARRSGARDLPRSSRQIQEGGGGDGGNSGSVAAVGGAEEGRSADVTSVLPLCSLMLFSILIDVFD